jgi:hypothetical protein
MRHWSSAPGTGWQWPEIVAALAAAYRSAGFKVQVLDAEGRKGHLLVTFPLSGTYRVDVLKEPLNHPVVWMEFGPVIALADAVALKMGALHDRGLPRDVLDAHGAAAYFTRPELIAACRAQRAITGMCSGRGALAIQQVLGPAQMRQLSDLHTRTAHRGETTIHSNSRSRPLVLRPGAHSC